GSDVPRTRRGCRRGNARLRDHERSGTADRWRGSPEHRNAVRHHQAPLERRPHPRAQPRIARHGAPPLVRTDRVRPRRRPRRGRPARADAVDRQAEAAVQAHMKSASRAERVFRRLLRLFPAEFRGDFGDEMAEAFDQQRRDTVEHGGSMGLARLWWDTLRGIITTAPREHWDLFRQDTRYGLRNL